MSRKAKKILLRVGAGPRMGLGHLRRSISLAHALKGYGVDGHFLLHPNSDALALVERAGCFGTLMKPSALFGKQDARDVTTAAGLFGTDLVLIDDDRIPVAYIEKLRREGFRVIVRDDLARWALPAQLVINGNADAERLDYRCWGDGTRFFLGPRYAVLPREYWQPIRRTARVRVRRVLVALGGADIGGWMPQLLKRLDRIPEPFEVTAVVGPFSRNLLHVRETVRRLGRPVQIVESPLSLADCIAEADLAVSAAGQTLYELACFGCPGVSFQVAANQRGQLEALAEAGCVRAVGESGDAGLLDRVEEALLELVASPVTRASMAQAGQDLIDGRGADRVACGILEEVS